MSSSKPTSEWTLAELVAEHKRLGKAEKALRADRLAVEALIERRRAAEQASAAAAKMTPAQKAAMKKALES